MLPIGLLLGLLRLAFSKGSSFPFIEYFVGGLISGLYSSAIAIFIPQTNPYLIIIGAVINMLPGVALTNGIRDLLHGDSVSGLTRLGEAFPLVPGVTAYQTMQSLVENKTQEAASYALNTVIKAFTIAFGIMIITALFRFVGKLKRKPIN